MQRTATWLKHTAAALLAAPVTTHRWSYPIWLWLGMRGGHRAHG